jgi:beta-N-acetylhexosaminidase
VVTAGAALLARTDWRPFQACRAAPLAMTAHVLYPALDPTRPATLSPTIVAEVIRGAIGFAGLLLSDDLSMGALSGTVGERAVAARAAGCDIALHCNGDLAAMSAVLEAAGRLEGASAVRARAALAHARPPEAFDAATAAADLADLLVAPVPTV